MSEVKNEASAKKPFFKSTSFKCIAVLLVIVLISGIFLTFCNALFYVSDEERLARALGKLYDGDSEITYTTEEVDSSVSVYDATVNTVYKITSYDGEYVLSVTGSGGFNSGTVTCYIRVYADSSAQTCEVKSISISTNVGQSYISKIKSKNLTALIEQQEDSGFTAFSTDGIKTGATFSMTAITNAANAASTYVKAKYLGVVTADPFENFEYLDYINKNSTSYSVSGDVVTYSIRTKTKSDSNGSSGAFTLTIKVDSTEKVTSFNIESGSADSGWTMYSGSYVDMGASDILELIDVENDTIVDGGALDTLDTGASLSNYLCAYAALFATANYQKCIDAEVNQ